MKKKCSLASLAVLATLAAPVWAAEPGQAPVQPDTAGADQAVAAATGKTTGKAKAKKALLEQVVVTASTDQVVETAGSVHFIDEAALEKSATGDVNRVLREVPGMNIVEEEGFGIRPNIGIRGSGTDRNSKIAVMEDGILIAPAPYAAPAAYYFPRMPRMSGVEVSKGPAAIKYGPQTVAGAVNLFSSPIPDKGVGNFGGKLDLFAGDFGTTRAHAVVGGYAPAGDSLEAGLMLETLQEKSDGFKELDSGGTTGFDIEDYVVKLGLRSSASADIQQSLELKLQSSEEVSDETYLGLTLEDFRDDPFRRYRGSQLDQINVDHETYQLTHQIELASNLSLTTIAYYTDTARNWFKLNDVHDGTALRSISAVLEDPAAYATAYQTLVGAAGYVSGDDALRVRNNNREYFSGGVQTVLGIGFEAGESAHQMEVSVRYHMDEEDRFQHDNRYRMDNGTMVLTTRGAPGSQDNRIGEANAIALFVRDTIDWSQWTFVPGIRYESIDLRQTRYGAADPDRKNPTSTSEDTVNVVVPGFGAMYHIDEEWKLIAGVHRGFASPAPGSAVEPEKSLNYEAGVRFAGSISRFDAIAFYNDYSNLVGTCTASTGSGCDIGDQFDGGEARVQGLELTAGHDVGAEAGFDISIPLTAAYTYTDAEFRNDFSSSFSEWGNVTAGDELPYVPQQQITLGMGVESDRWRTNLTINFVDEARSTAGSGSIADNDLVDGRTLIDLSGEYDVTANVSLFASIENLGNEVYNVGFRPAGARPGMPRSFLMGLKVDF